MAVIDRLFAPDSTFQKNFFFLAKRFVAGETIGTALEAVARLNAEGMTATLDFLGEDVLDPTAAAATRDAYLAMLDAIGTSGLRTNVSVKLTAMGLLIGEDFALENLAMVLRRAAVNPDPFVRVDMEGSAITDATLRVVDRAFAEHGNVGSVLQAYLKRTPSDIAHAIELRQRVRICKGAYNEPESIAIKTMPEIRNQFLTLAKRLLLEGNYPALATHDIGVVAELERFIAERGISPDRYEFQMLFGCRPGLQRELVARGHRVRIYVPFGTHWAGYFFRRVMERRENAIFALSSMFSK
uniref:proline dehydrogenase n=1 Tax=mine drainage metagenome TaxID=410659 RepID=E6Q1L2_9ZZZZ